MRDDTKNKTFIDQLERMRIENDPHTESISSKEMLSPTMQRKSQIFNEIVLRKPGLATNKRKINLNIFSYHIYKSKHQKK